MSIKILMSAFGWGVPHNTKINNKIIFNFIYPPITKYKPLFRGLILNGYLNQIYGKKFKCEVIEDTKMIFS